MAKEFPELQGIFLWKESDTDPGESGSVRPFYEHTKRGGTAGMRLMSYLMLRPRQNGSFWIHAAGDFFAGFRQKKW